MLIARMMITWVTIMTMTMMGDVFETVQGGASYALVIVYHFAGCWLSV